MSTKSAFLTSAIAAVALSACAGEKGLYEWGAYEGNLYAYAKKPDKREDYRETLMKAIEKGEENNRVAPSLNAELGFLFLEDGDLVLAAQYFEAEKRLFPESAYFLDSILDRARGHEPAESQSETIEPSAESSNEETTS